ncbi:MAG: outer membrane beta-barrel protein [Vicinamibacteria bacterium]
MTPLAVLVLAAALEGPRVLAVQIGPFEGRLAVRVLALETLGDVQIERDGGELRVSFPGVLDPLLAVPPPQPPIESLGLEQVESRVVLRIRAAADTPLEVHPEGSLLAVTVGTPGAAPADADIEKLYPLLYPQATPDVYAEPAPEETPAAEAETPVASSGWRLGLLEFRPGAVVRYVDADVTLGDSPTPERVQYVEVQPTLGAVGVASATGNVTLKYEPRLRFTQDDVPLLDEVSHFVSGSVRLPITPSYSFTVSDQWSRGTVETDVVDPGREYFYQLGTFEENRVSGRLVKESDARLGFDAGGFYEDVQVDDQSSYFDYQRWGLGAGLRYELSPGLHATLGYSYDRVLAPDTRQVVESTAHIATLGLDGELAYLTKGRLEVGFRSQRNPNAPPGGDRFAGLITNASVTRETPSGATITLGASRDSFPSSFENNGFYVATRVTAGLTFGLPFSIKASVGGGYQWNRYELPAAQLGAPREDDIAGWTAGLSRSLTRFAFLRADYRRDRRTSNLPEIPNTTHSLLVQLGVGIGQ